MAPLCRSCAESASFLDGAHCPHEDPREREIVGSFTFIDLVYALEAQEYQLQEVYELYYYQQSTTNLLEKLLETSARLKVLSEGYPEHIETDEEKTRFAAELARSTGLDITADAIFKSQALRMVGKLLMNSVIGKLGQKIIRTSKFYVQSYQTLANLRKNRLFTINSYGVVS